MNKCYFNFINGEKQMFKKSITVFTAICLVVTLSGCATIVSGRNQDLPVYSSPSGAIVSVGTMKQTSPATFALDRRQGAYVVTVEKDGYESVEVKLKKGVNGWVFGNIVFGGIIGLVIDISTGSASKFTPDEVDANLINRELTLKDVEGKDVLFVKLVNSSEAVVK
ncbi:PEGA domain-containing protein [Candidatus Omnitrophota bacterium]